MPAAQQHEISRSLPFKLQLNKGFPDQHANMSETSHIETYERGHIGVNSGDRTGREKDRGRCDSSEG